MKEFNSLEEIKQYYNEETNTYEFKENIVLNFDLNVEADIDAKHIKYCHFAQNKPQNNKN